MNYNLKESLLDDVGLKAVLFRLRGTVSVRSACDLLTQKDHQSNPRGFCVQLPLTCTTGTALSVLMASGYLTIFLSDGFTRTTTFSSFGGLCRNYDSAWSRFSASTRGGGTLQRLILLSLPPRPRQLSSRAADAPTIPQL